MSVGSAQIPWKLEQGILSLLQGSDRGAAGTVSDFASASVWQVPTEHFALPGPVDGKGDCLQCFEGQARRLAVSYHDRQARNKPQTGSASDSGG